MALHFGVENTFGLSAPAVGYVNEADEDESIDGVATVEDENGVTVIATPKLLTKKTVSIKGKGDAEFANVVPGAFTAGVVKITEAKQSESQDEYPDFEIKGEAFDTLVLA